MPTTLASPQELRAPLVDKIDRFVALTPAERAFLETLQAEFIRVPTGRDVITAGRAYRTLFVLNRGIAIRYKVLHDGRRQVLGVILPGDFIGFPGGLFETALFSVASLTETVVSPVPFRALFELCRQHPKLGATLLWLVGHEAALFADHLVGIGRQTAYERVARLLLELLVRLQGVGLADERSYRLPLTQELMADALGLSVPHVNRTLRRLRDDGMIDLTNGRVIVSDLAALSSLADFDVAAMRWQRIPGLDGAEAPASV